MLDISSPPRLVSGRLNRRQSLGLILGLAASTAGGQELDDLAKIRSRGILKVAVYKDNPPFSSGSSSDMSGIDVALAQALAKQLKLKLELLPFDAGENMNDDLRNMVWRGHYLGYGPADVMLNVPADKYLMQQNRQVVILLPYMRQIPVLLHAAKVLAQVNSTQDLKGHKLAAERGTGTASALIGPGNGLQGSQVSLFSTGVEAAQAVLRGEVDGAYVLRSQAEAAIALDKTKQVSTLMSALPLNGLPENGWPIGMAIKSSFKDLGGALDAAMKELRASGELQAMFAQQGLTLTTP